MWFRHRGIAVSQPLVTLVPLLTLSTFLAPAAAPARADVPHTIAMQGRLLNVAGQTLADGTYALTFRLYAAPTGGTALWTEVQPSVPVHGGVFAAALGSVTPFPSSLRFDTAYYLGVQVGSDAEMAPRLPLLAAPYALALPSFRTETTATDPNVIGGNAENSVLAGKAGATISGGGSAGKANSVLDDYGAVGGGLQNQAGAGPSGAFPGPYAAVGGGTGNIASGESAVVGGGEGNNAAGFWSVIGGGYHNTTTNSTSMIPGGAYCIADGYYSFAAGQTAEAMHDGAFVWADNHIQHFPSTAPDEFSVRATGGVRLVTGIDTTQGANEGKPTAFFTLNANGGSATDPFLITSTGATLTTGGVWQNNSDRNRKEDVVPANPERILESVAVLPVSTWSYKAEGPSIRHIGPMAQDFAAAFHMGADDRHIGTVDADGVALAAIQGLYQREKAKDARIAGLEQANAKLAARLAALEKRISGTARRSR